MADLTFPSVEWCRAMAAALHADPTVHAALAEFGPFTGGAVVERGAGLARDFCVLARVVPGQPPVLEFPDDEDELEEAEPDYLAHVPHALARQLLQDALRGQIPDPVQFLLSGRVQLAGDVQRIVRVAPRHPTAGRAALKTVPTRFL